MSRSFQLSKTVKQKLYKKLPEDDLSHMYDLCFSRILHSIISLMYLYPPCYTMVVMTGSLIPRTSKEHSFQIYQILLASWKWTHGTIWILSGEFEQTSTFIVIWLKEWIWDSTNDMFRLHSRGDTSNIERSYEAHSNVWDMM